MNILIITHYFPPLAHIGLRPYYLAKYLSKNGNNVFVLTTKKIPIHGVISYGLKPEGFDVIDIPHLPFHLFLGLRKNLGKKPSNTKLLNKSILLLLKDVRDFFLKIFGPNFDIFLPCAPIMFLRTVELMRTNKIDAVITSHPPPFVFFVGYLIKKVRPDIVWIADFRDLWSYDVHFSNPISRFLSAPLEKYIISFADEVVTVSDALARNLQKLHKRDVHVIRNSFDPDILPLGEKKIRRSTSSSENKKIKFVYTGAFYPKGINPTNFFSALSILKSRYKDLSRLLEVEIYGVPNIDLEGLIKKYGIGDIVFYRGLVSQKESFRIQRSADFLLFFNVTEVVFGGDLDKGVVTGKIYEYITSGVPIISIGVMEDSEANKIIKETGTGIFVYNSPHVIADFLEDLIIRRRGVAYFFDPKPEKIMDYSAGKMAQKFLDLIERRVRATQRG